MQKGISNYHRRALTLASITPFKHLGDLHEVFGACDCEHADIVAQFTAATSASLIKSLSIKRKSECFQ